MHYSARRDGIYYYRKGFGIGSASPVVLYRYPSYLGVLETDRRALKRLMKKGGKEIKSVLALLEKRWKTKIPSADEFLRQ